MAASITTKTLEPRRGASIATRLSLTASFLDDLGRVFSSPGLKALSATLQATAEGTNKLDKHSQQISRFLEDINLGACAITNLCAADAQMPNGGLSSKTMRQMAVFLETAKKVQQLVETEVQPDGQPGTLKHFLSLGFRGLLAKQNQSHLNECKNSMKSAMESLNVKLVSTDFETMQIQAQLAHDEVLDKIASMSSQTSESGEYLGSSTTSLSLLPSRPKLFFGREREVEQITAIISQPATPRIVILGTGGIGKTCLARAIMHHPTVAERYSFLEDTGNTHYIFLSCDRAHNLADLLVLCAVHLALDPGAGNAKANILDCLTQRTVSQKAGCLLFLDNLETCWEADTTRPVIEAFLGQLSAIANLGLIITMRGTERPANVQWSRPFLPPLQPFSPSAALDTFLAITDNFDTESDVEKILNLTDNLPLAVDLLGNLVDAEGCSAVLRSWESHKTSLVSGGQNPHSSLNASIGLSLVSPRMTEGARELLGILAILPDGLTDAQLLENKQFGIKNILTCKATLLRTSLAYIDPWYAWVKVLVPIREYMQLKHPAPQGVVGNLIEHFCNIIQWTKSKRLGTNSFIQNLGNITSILGLTFKQNNVSSKIMMSCIELNNLSTFMGFGDQTDLLDHVQRLLNTKDMQHNHQLQCYFLREYFHSAVHDGSVATGDQDAMVQQFHAHLEELAILY
ncbi:NB-ARC domain-containing protein [Mycena kentingensis (nom. inval.)]|nr:NB-ARC domain-containing protein [Mycena kentingensis (nom. inval.)]